MNYTILWMEISTDPLTRGYAGMTDAQVADSLNTVDRTTPRISVTGQEIFNNTDKDELLALSTASQNWYRWITQMENVNSGPGTNGRDMMLALFAGSPITLAALTSLVTTDLPISRAEELGIGIVGVSDVARVRRENV